MVGSQGGEVFSDALMVTLPVIPKSTWHILRILCEEKEGISVQQLAAIAKASRRMIYYDLDTIRFLLDTMKLGELPHKKCGYYLKEEQKTALMALLVAQGDIHDKEDRISYMIINVIFHEHIIRIEHFCEKFEVTRNTILKDLSEVKQILESSQLHLKNTKREGYFVEGDIFRKRTIFLHHLKQLLKHIHYSKLDFFNLDVIEEYQKKLKEIFVMSDITVPQDDIVALSYLLQTMHIAPMNYRFNVNDLSNICATKELKYVDRYFTELSYHERIYLTIQLLGYGNNREFLDLNGEKYLYLQDLAIQLVDMFEKVSCMRFERKDELVSSIYMHMKLSYYNYCYSVPSSNPLSEDIKENYTELFKITEVCCQKLKDSFPYPYFDSELTYLTMHFASFIRKEKKKIIYANVVLVCLNGTSSSILLKNEIESHFENINVVDIVNKREFSDKQYEETIDFVISTIDLECEYPLIRVNPILSMKDKANVASFMMMSHADYRMENQQLKVLLNILQRHVDEKTFDHICEDICSYMNSGGFLLSYEEDHQATLCEMLARSSIRLHGEYGIDWRDAIWDCSEALLKHHDIHKAYVERMIELVEGYGPYIVISPMVAIAHAQPEDGVVHLGIALNIYTKGLSIGNASIKFLFVLATPNQSDHLHILQDIMTLNEHEECMQRILHSGCETQVMEELHDLLERDPSL